MARQITGFVDDCWEIRDGVVVRRALDHSYKEHLLSGISIEHIIDEKLFNESQYHSLMPVAPRAFDVWLTYWSSKPIRPDFIEPCVIKPLKCPRCKTILNKEWEWHTCLAWVTCNVCSQDYQDDPESDDHFCGDYDDWDCNGHGDGHSDDDCDDIIEPSAFRNHHRKKRRNSRKSPAHEPKANKNASVLARGKIRIDDSPPTNLAKDQEKWVDECETYLDYLGYKLRWGEIQYRWYQVDKIIQRFRANLEQGDNIESRWKSIGPHILENYEPYKKSNVNITRRYFEWIEDDFDEFDEFDDWHSTRLNIYLA
jgi:hypothetical protein